MSKPQKPGIMAWTRNDKKPEKSKIKVKHNTWRRSPENTNILAETLNNSLKTRQNVELHLSLLKPNKNLCKKNRSKTPKCIRTFTTIGIIANAIETKN